MAFSFHEASLLSKYYFFKTVFKRKKIIWEKIMIITSLLFFQKFCDCIILIYFTDFMNSNHPSYIPLVPPVPPPPPPPPFSPPPPPPNTIKKHKWHKIDCRKLSWETLSPDLLKQDTVWKKVGKRVFCLPYLVKSCNDIICNRLVSCFNFLKCFQVGKNLPLEGIFDCEDIRREFSIIPSQGRQN